MKHLAGLLITLFVSTTALPQFVSYRDLKDLMEENMLKDKECFVILKTGDTIFSNKLTVVKFYNYSTFNGYASVNFVKINGKKYKGDEIDALQNDETYAVLDYRKVPCGRIATGKINVYCYQHFQSKKVPNSDGYEPGMTKTYFVLQKGNKLPAQMVPMSFDNLRNAVADNADALTTFERLYPKPDKEDNDYEKFLQVIKVY